MVAHQALPRYYSFYVQELFLVVTWGTMWDAKLVSVTCMTNALPTLLSISPVPWLNYYAISFHTQYKFCSLSTYVKILFRAMNLYDLSDNFKVTS